MSPESRRNLHTHTHTHTTNALLSIFSFIFNRVLIAFIICAASVFSAHAVNVIYNLNGGALPNGETAYSVESGQNTVVLENPTKTGFIFTGWCDSNYYSNVNGKDTCSTDRVGLATVTNNNASKTIVRWTVPDNLSTDTTYIAMWEEDKFQVTTTNLVVNDAVFDFYMTAAGTFWVDWGDGVVEYIDRTNDTSYTNYSHAYSVGEDGGFYTVRFAGVTTGYRQEYASNDWSIIPSPISFYNNTKVASIAGSLGQLFSTLGDTTVSGLTEYVIHRIQPRFYKIFSGCTNLTGEIPEDLFLGVEGTPVEYMFNAIFKDCSGLTGSIPEKLFGRVVNNEYRGVKGAPSHRMFEGAFSGCSGLTGSIPENLFKGIIGAPSQAMFADTFSDCSGLTGSIPENLFAGISGSPTYAMFDGTFQGCFRLTGSIPENLFGRTIKDANNNDVYYGIDGVADSSSSAFGMTFSGCSSLTGSIPEKLFGRIVNNEYHGVKGAPHVAMFFGTFQSCSGLTGSIPSGLFGGLYGSPARLMFTATFNGCSGLTGSIPATLFSGISGTPEEAMFEYTFKNCSGLTGYIPPTLFSGIDSDPLSAATDQMLDVFDNSGLLTSCSPASSQYTTGFEEYFDGKVACIPADSILCKTGEVFANNKCNACTENCLTRDTLYKCPNGMGGNATYDECITAYTLHYDLDGGTAVNPTLYTVETPTFTLNNPVKDRYNFVGWCVYNSANNAGVNCSYPQPEVSIMLNSTGDKWLYAKFEEQTVQCPAGEYALTYDSKTGIYNGVVRADDHLTCDNCPGNYYCPGDNGNPKTYRWSDLSEITVWGNRVQLAAGVNLCADADQTKPYSNFGAKSVSECNLCPPTYMFGEEDGFGILNFGNSWFDLNGDKAPDSSECIDVMYTQEMLTCMMKAMCENMPAQALQSMLGSNYATKCAQLSSVTCDYAGDKVSYMTCRYNATSYQNTGIYTKCSKMVNICNETELLNILSVLMNNQSQSSAVMFPVELNTRTDVDTSDLSKVNWGDYFYQDLMSVVAQIMGGTETATAIASLDKYNTCSGPTCDSGVELIIIDAPMCLLDTEPEEGIMSVIAYKRDSTDNTKINTYYIPLTTTPTEVHAGSGHQLIIKTYHGNTAMSYYAHDASVE